MARTKEGIKVVAVEMPVELVAQLEDLAITNERSLSGEIRIAIRKHIKAETTPIVRERLD